MEKSDKNMTLVNIIKFELGAVRGNVLMSAADKNAKIKQLKLLAPNCKDWEGLDDLVVEKNKFSAISPY